MSEPDFETDFWSIVLHEPLHDPRLRRAVRFILTGEVPEEGLTPQELDYGVLKIKMQRDHRLNDEEFYKAFGLVERELEMELYGEA